MKPGTASNLILAALLALAGAQFHRAMNQLDQVAERLQELDTRVAVLEAQRARL